MKAIEHESCRARGTPRTPWKRAQPSAQPSTALRRYVAVTPTSLFHVAIDWPGRGRSPGDAHAAEQKPEARLRDPHSPSPSSSLTHHRTGTGASVSQLDESTVLETISS